MRAHVFITNSDTYPIVRDNSFWGVKITGSIPNTYEELLETRSYLGLVGDILATRIGDIVFLYENQVGFHGIYKITNRPFFDTTPIFCIGGNYPLRVEIKCLNYFPEPVPEGYLFSTKEYESRFWVWFYRKIQGGRGISTINPEAADGLMELLVKINGNAVKALNSFKNYPSENRENITVPLGRGGPVKWEVILRAWLVSNIDNAEKRNLREIFGPIEDLEWFANNVPYYVTGKNIDILCYHKNERYTGFPLRYKFSVVELKKDTADEKDVMQVVEYSKWVAGRLAGSEIETVQPILIAYKFNKKAILKVANSDFSYKGIKLYLYKVENNDIHFEEVSY